MLKVVLIVLLVVLVVLLGIPFGMPMSAGSGCPECTPAGAGAWGAMCAAVLVSVALLLQLGATRNLVGRSRRPLFVAGAVLERPPRLSS